MVSYSQVRLDAVYIAMVYIVLTDMIYHTYTLDIVSISLKPRQTRGEERSECRPLTLVPVLETLAAQPYRIRRRPFLRRL